MPTLTDYFFCCFNGIFLQLSQNFAIQSIYGNNCQIFNILQHFDVCDTNLYIFDMVFMHLT